MNSVLDDPEALHQLGVLSRKAAKLRRAATDVSELRDLLFENAMMRCEKIARTAPPKPEPIKRDKLIFSQYYEPLPRPSQLAIETLIEGSSRSRGSYHSTASPTEADSQTATSRATSLSQTHHNSSVAFSSFASPTAESLRARVVAAAGKAEPPPRVSLHDISLNSVATIPQQGAQFEQKQIIDGLDEEDTSSVSPVSSCSKKEPSPPSSHSSRVSTCSLTWSELPIAAGAT
eukprot:TRINITY_DN37161_c0_g1_i1.p1 TRINITY_DN37161_c0_g1~~TRINITY_DN37161_c0_g1_i1.p1  ORF type:complete len:243 (+),score=39.18 TRINITY_DN37161_c0_g1_i1:36-731(+)